MGSPGIQKKIFKVAWTEKNVPGAAYAMTRGLAGNFEFIGGSAIS